MKKVVYINDGVSEIENQLQTLSQSTEDVKCHLITKLAEELKICKYSDETANGKGVDLKVDKQIQTLSQDIEDVKIDLRGWLAHVIESVGKQLYEKCKGVEN